MTESGQWFCQVLSSSGGLSTFVRSEGTSNCEIGSSQIWVLVTWEGVGVLVWLIFVPPRLAYIKRKRARLERQEILVLGVLPTLVLGFVAIIGVAVALPNIEAGTRLVYVEITTATFVILFVVTILLYKFLPKSSQEKLKEQTDRLTNENQKKWAALLDRQLEREKIDLQRQGIPTVSEMVTKLQTEEQRLRPSDLVQLTPLPHFKGYLLPPKIERLPDLPDGKHQASLTHVGASSPDRARLSRSQIIDTYWNIDLDDPSKSKELIAKFGVIRVTARLKQLNNILAELKINRVRDAIHPNPMSYYLTSEGYLNWFSIDIKNRILQDHTVLSDIDKNRGYGLNKYLLNPKETIHIDESRDLLLFYMIKNISSVFLCVGSTTSTAGISLDDKPVEFQAEISITADDFPKTTWLFRISACWDDYNIEQL